MVSSSVESQNPGILKCSDCQLSVEEQPTYIEFEGQEIHLFHPVLCRACLLKQCKNYSVDCANCGKKIPPYSQVGVLKADHGAIEYVHLRSFCSTAGNAFYGYWGKGKLGEYVQVEAC